MARSGRQFQYLTNEEMLARLREELPSGTARGRGGKLARWARLAGVNPTSLSLVLGGKRDVPESIANVLGYHKVAPGVYVSTLVYTRGTQHGE